MVVPCKDEPALGETLASLCRTTPPPRFAEVIVVVNASTADPDAVRARSAANAAEARAVARARGAAAPVLHVIEELELEPRHAGVGLARKLGMDEAAARLDAVGAARGGVIVCLDADCTVAPTYLAEIAAWFERHPRADAASIAFEHDLESVVEPRHRAGIAGYELFLRCHVHGLRLAGHPSAIHTIGSSMAVRAETYAIHGGMNRRKAGEDFYFLQKLVEHGAVGTIRSTTVFPSPRVSDRVPFGTGRAIGDWLAGDEAEFLAYDARVYSMLGELVARIERWWGARQADPLDGLPAVVVDFLVAEGFPEALGGMFANATTLASFRARFLAWLSPFRALKLVHHLTREHLPRRPVTETAAALAASARPGGGDPPLVAVGVEPWLEWFRRIDREAPGEEDR
ncbi:MAG: glycosyltransferase family 2 protein [Deltaproteobacteria bacterium]|nr:glycosyltransferase family 2 protein [Deltaproteobacteria bacterium]